MALPKKKRENKHYTPVAITTVNKELSLSFKASLILSLEFLRESTKNHFSSRWRSSPPAHTDEPPHVHPSPRRSRREMGATSFSIPQLSRLTVPESKVGKETDPLMPPKHFTRCDIRPSERDGFGKMRAH